MRSKSEVIVDSEINHNNIAIENSIQTKPNNITIDIESSEVTCRIERIPELEKIKNTIETLSKNHQIEILKILKKSNKVIINENKNGVFINLSFLPDEVLEEIREYLHFIHDQEDALSTLEHQKNQFKNEFFSENTED